MKITELIKRGRTLFPSIKWGYGKIFRFSKEGEICEACALGFAILGLDNHEEFKKNAIDSNKGLIIFNEYDGLARITGIPENKIDEVWNTNDTLIQDRKSPEEVIASLEEKDL